MGFRPDGVTWTAQQIDMGRIWLYGIASNGIQWVIVGQRQGIYTSKDGILWTRVFREAVGDFKVVLWTGAKWLVMGGGKALTSTDGIQWTSTSYPRNVSSAVWTGNQFVAVGWV